MFTRTIWWADEGDDAPAVVIDQTRLPHETTTVEWHTVDHAADGIATMQVRGAPLIGVAATYGLALAMRADPTSLSDACERLMATRPTAVNLRWAIERMRTALAPLDPADRITAARSLADLLTGTSIESCRRIADAGLPVIEATHAHTGAPVHVLTHCNAGWLACVEWGTATAAVYLAHERGIPIHVWVSETRPRNQGAALTAWELGQRGVPHTLIVDSAAGHLLGSGGVDLVVVGADRIAANGDAANKIGTYLKALAARDRGVPFVVAAPRSTFDAACPSGADIPIEERDPTEVTMVNGGLITPATTTARNWAFDVTPARLIDAYWTDAGAIAPGGLAAFMEASLDA